MLENLSDDFSQRQRAEVLLRQKKQNAYSYFLEVLFWHNQLLRRVLQAGNKMLKYFVLQQNKVHAEF